jgi:hypothetical protein
LGKGGTMASEKVDLSTKERLVDLENKDRKEDQQRRMAWIAMISMLVFTVILFLPIISTERVAALSDVLSMFYIAQAGVVASFFGSTAYMSRNQSL